MKNRSVLSLIFAGVATSMVAVTVAMGTPGVLSVITLGFIAFTCFIQASISWMKNEELKKLRKLLEVWADELIALGENDATR